MNKYIHDFIRNNSRCLFKGLTRPQKKAVTEVIRGLYVSGMPILRRLAQNKQISAKKQGEKYGYHLNHISLLKKIEDHALKFVRGKIRKNTIIAYDLTDIAKDCSKKVAFLQRIFDGSRRRVTNGTTLHGVGVHGMLLKLCVHDGRKKTLNQVRKKMVTELAKAFRGKGIWVFDRGNDDKQFFCFLRQKLNLQFIARLKRNRLVVIKETGVICKVFELPTGIYKVYLMNKYNTKADKRYEYTLVIDKHLKNKAPIRLLAHLSDSYGSKQIINMYLERWGIENIFKRIKDCFELEKIRVFNEQTFVNLLALIQFAANVSIIAFHKIQQLTDSMISGVLSLYKKFLKIESLTFNLTSFTRFLQESLKSLVAQPKRAPPHQPSLLSRRVLEKLGSI